MPAALEFVSSMDDCSLKARMLQSVVRENLPDEKRPFGNPADMGAILSQVLTFGLLSERYPDSADRNLVEEWRNGLDLWSERIVLLTSNRVPDKGWAGVGFLGVTCRECSSERFQTSFFLWFQKLLENIQQPSTSNFIKVTCCGSLCDLFTRLACFPNLKKDATSLSGKVIQPILQLLNDEGSDTVWEGATSLLCKVIFFFPSSIRRHYDSVEAVLASKIMAAKCDLNVSKKFAQCLAHLPKVKGDEDSWCLIMQKILVVINSTLTDEFQVLEEEKKGHEIMKMIVPPGMETPPPLGGQRWSGEASVPATKRLRELLVPRVTALIHSLCKMLTESYPVQVSIPVRPLLATVRRVLKIDGSLSGLLFPFATPLHQELLCAELPDLHLSALDLLIAIITGLESQLLPHGSQVVQLLTDYLRRARIPSLRIKAYSIVQMLLISMGAGMALYLAEEVVKNAFSDLTDHHGTGEMLSNAHSSAGMANPLPQSHHKKRKRISISAAEHPKVDSGNEPLSKNRQTLSVKIAALKALETLLTVGGSLKSEHWRPHVDCLLINVATNAYDANLENEKKFCMLTDQSSYDDFQLAASEALLTSLLSPTPTQPSYLSLCFNLFVRGKQQTGTKLSSFCAHAILILEAKNSKVLPLVVNPTKNSSIDDVDFNQGFLGGTFNHRNVTGGDRKVLDDEDRELNNFWLNDDEPTQGTSVDDRIMNNKHIDSTEQSLKGSADITGKELTDNTEETHHFEGQLNYSLNLDVEMACLATDRQAMDNDKEEMESRNETSFDTASGLLPPSKADTHLSNSIINVSKEDDHPQKMPALNKDSKLSYDSDNTSMDSLPDIVDADPDTE